MGPLLLLLACGVENGSDDRGAYVDLLSAEDLATQARIEACLSLADPDLAGDCALVAAEAAPARGEGPIEAWCERFPAGPWQDECWFRAAEHALARDRDPVRAARLCTTSGSFSAPCAVHLWAVGLLPILGRDGPEAFGSHLAEAAVLLERWMPEEIRDPAVEEGFWGQYYAIGFERAPGVLPSACAPLDEPHRSRCETAAANVWSSRLATILRRTEALGSFCARTAASATVAALLTERADVPPVPGRIQTEPTPALDAAVARLHESRCLSGSSEKDSPP
ncbi:MAG: hypothetical protein JXB39_09155 [Deltaproteobacteria bacterium]|nr:hypothetical protein [Deltaproteobacteria bacterium]